MKIRTAGVQDLETVSRIHALSWKTAYRGILPDDFLNQLSYRRWVAPLKDMMEQGLEIRVIEEEEKPFGCITFSAARDQAFAGWGEIVSFHLLLEARGKGYGRLLIQDAVRQLKEKGYSKIYLWVLEKNERARRFYEKNGFTWNGDRLKGKKAGERSRILDMFYLSLKQIYLKHKFSKQTKAVQSLPPMAAIFEQPFVIS